VSLFRGKSDPDEDFPAMTFHACHKSDWRGPWQFKYVEAMELFRPSGAWVLEWGLQGEVQRAWRANNLSEHLNGSSGPGAACQCSITGTPAPKIPRSLTAWTKSKLYAGWCGTRELITPGDPIRIVFC
jgi:hypothetical protein